jgi:hypothetical protein
MPTQGQHRKWFSLPYPMPPPIKWFQISERKAGGGRAWPRSHWKHASAPGCSKCMGWCAVGKVWAKCNDLCTIILVNCQARDNPWWVLSGTTKINHPWEGRVYLSNKKCLLVKWNDVKWVNNESNSQSNETAWALESEKILSYCSFILKITRWRFLKVQI